MFKISTAVRNGLLVTGSFKELMDGAYLKIYGSPVSKDAAIALIPTTADAALGASTLLSTISLNGLGVTGLTFENSAVNGIIQKNTAETWQGTNVASGYPSFYRLVLASDTGAQSVSEFRAQGTVGIVGSDLVIAAEYMVSGQVQRVDAYAVGMLGE